VLNRFLFSNQSLEGWPGTGTHTGGRDRERERRVTNEISFLRRGARELECGTELEKMSYQATG
jgi:hypothetical protein